jgi:hypothetical protein
MKNLGLISEEDLWTGMQDESEREFLRMKYADAKARQSLCDDWIAKRKHADSSVTTTEGKPNPQYPRLKLEADVARTNYEIAHVIEMNRQMLKQMELFCSVLPRLDMVEGSYSYLRQALDHAKTSYNESRINHLKDRKEWSTDMAMRRAGLDPDKAEHKLMWAQRLDDLNARLFNIEKENYDVQGSGDTGKKSNILSPEERPKDE